MMSIITWLQHNWIAPVVVVFLLILVSTYWPGRKSQMERHGRIPLEDDR
jgi:cbb3-type cytochrome oxidase subunit 3